MAADTWVKTHNGYGMWFFPQGDLPSELSILFVISQTLARVATIGR
ncbi:MAG: hypothetical protein ACNA78_00995 [Balneolaceae bacterium]